MAFMAPIPTSVLPSLPARAEPEEGSDAKVEGAGNARGCCEIAEQEDSRRVG